MMPVGDKGHLRDYLRIIRKRKTTVLAFVAVVFGTVCVGTYLTMPLYEGANKIIIDRGESENLTGRLSIPGRDPEFFETQFQLLKSRAVASRVVDTLTLEEPKNFLASFVAARGKDGLSDKIIEGWRQTRAWLKEFFVKPDKKPEPLSDREELISMISNGLQVEPVGTSRIVSLRFRSFNPEFAARVVNTAATAYMEEILSMKLEATRRTLGWMTLKASGEGQNLERAETLLQDYMSKNDIVTLENRVTVTPEKLGEISVQLVRAEAQRKELETLTKKLSQVERDQEGAETVAAITADPALRNLRSQIVETEKNIMQLSGKYGAKHPTMLKATADLSILKEKKAQEIQRIIRSIQNDYELALAKESSLRRELEQTKGEAQRLNEKFIQYGVLKREVDTNRQLFDALMLKIKEQSITQETEPVKLWIVEEALIPTEPAWPLTKLNLTLGLLLGGLGGIGLAFFLEYLDNTIKSPEETEAILKVPVLGMVSKFEGTPGRIEEVLLRNPNSIFAENYKALRTSVMLSSASGPPPRLLVTSAAAGEGKTTTAINLAIALAQSEKRILLIDADLRKPRIHKAFRLNNDNGLSLYLAGGSAQDLLKKGPHAHLSVITSGPLPPNPSELLMSSRMDDLVKSLNANFDIIICDSPPLLSVADARTLSRIFTSVILVTQAQQTTYEMAERSLKSLKDVDGKVLGVLVNGFDAKKSDYDYDKYYAPYCNQPSSAEMN